MYQACHYKLNTVTDLTQAKKRSNSWEINFTRWLKRPFASQRECALLGHQGSANYSSFRLFQNWTYQAKLLRRKRFSCRYQFQPLNINFYPPLPQRDPLSKNKKQNKTKKKQQLKNFGTVIIKSAEVNTRYAASADLLLVRSVLGSAVQDFQRSRRSVSIPEK